MERGRHEHRDERHHVDVPAERRYAFHRRDELRHDAVEAQVIGQGERGHAESRIAEHVEQHEQTIESPHHFCSRDRPLLAAGAFLRHQNRRAVSLTSGDAAGILAASESTGGALASGGAASRRPGDPPATSRSSFPYRLEAPPRAGHPGGPRPLRPAARGRGRLAAPGRPSARHRRFRPWTCRRWPARPPG